ncbi:hypothetical protein I350_07185 [Cryptococcus amylolentus CBS 6273]|uniref:ABC transporter domain-containing protein n=1 Tax=Cryptococcus amylolentus CBS 6273 TaxID=1296118 RepID=A0A1E3JDT2_9TREE|nr:hypothetical protein I350_07185 [Cryptococcus amylolentus CBS 6273]
MPNKLPLVRIPPQALVHRFGAPASAPRSSALLRFSDDGWTINRQVVKPEGWAIVGDAEGRKLAVETLLSRHRIQPLPPPPGPFPYINSLITPSSTLPDPTSPPPPAKAIRHLAFARPPSTGEFTDFTARYGTLLEEDRLSFRQTLKNLQPPPSDEAIERVARLMRIEDLLDLPSVSFSSGQTRRGRIASALLTRPHLLLIEDPMAGLDIPSRAEVSRLLGELNADVEQGIKIALVLRGKGGEEMPDWITNVAEVRGGDVWVGSREEYDVRREGREAHEKKKVTEVVEINDEIAGEPVVKLDKVSVSYGEGTRPVLKEVSWTIQPGSKWHLIGANGSGKTTLLSLILGHHPTSYSLPPLSLQLFSRPRRAIPTPILRTLMGHTSPEIYASFPRGMGLGAGEVVGSGFEGVFSRRMLNAKQKERVEYLLGYFVDLLKPLPRAGIAAPTSVHDLFERPFITFTPPQQALLLFLRAIVTRPKLLILDEPSQGMDEDLWERCKALLEEEWKAEGGREMAVVVVSHYEDEVPWERGRGRVLKLDQGVATVQ